MNRPSWVADALVEATACGTDVPSALALAVEVGRHLPLPGHGLTGFRWQVLSDLAQANVTAARIIEAHTDAIAIRAEAGWGETDGRTWGVFAAESAEADVASRETGSGPALTGYKPWCSLGGDLDAALVTARSDGGTRLFEVDLRHSGVSARPPGAWVARGLSSVVSTGIDFHSVPARVVGPPGWYLMRPGFAWGGIGVAACWLGAARGVAEAMAGARSGDIVDLHAGRVDLALHAASCVLDAAAQQIDSGTSTRASDTVLALRARSIVAAACESVLRDVAHATGPEPMTFDERHAARCADLELYLRQHHGERDIAALGARIRA